MAYSLLRPGTASRADLGPAAPQAHILAAIRDAEASGFSGDLHIQRGTVRGKVRFASGSILWVHCGGWGGVLAEVVMQYGSLRPPMVANAVEESRNRGIPLGEFLLSSGLMKRCEVEVLLRIHHSAQLERILLRIGPVSTVFLPGPADPEMTLRTSLDQLVTHPFEPIAPSALGPLALRLAARLPMVPGAAGVGVVRARGDQSDQGDFHVLPDATATKQNIRALWERAASISSGTAPPLLKVPSWTHPAAQTETLGVWGRLMYYQRTVSELIVFFAAPIDADPGPFADGAAPALDDVTATTI